MSHPTSFEDANRTAFQFKLGETDEREAINGIWIFLFENPAFFGLKSLDEDQKSDFLLWFSDKIPSIIRNYNGAEENFTFFLKICVQKAFFTWIKKQAKKSAGEECLTSFSMDSGETDGTAEIEHLFSDDRLTLGQRAKNASEKKISMSKKLVLILACRACNDITENLMLKISDFLETDIEKLSETIQFLKERTKEKEERRRKAIERRNASFFFKRRYSVELEKLDSASCLYEKTKEKLAAQSATWKLANERLHTRFLNSPSREEIARQVGIKPRQVSYYLNHYARKIEHFPFINYPKGEKSEEQDEE